MKYKQNIKDLYKIAGMLEMLTCMQDLPITSGMVAELADAVDKLELICAELANEGYEIMLDFNPNIRPLDFFDDERMRPLHDERPMKKVVKVHEGTEDSPPLNRSRPINKRPGRCVCVCTAKGKIVYIEDQFTHNKNSRR